MCAAARHSQPQATGQRHASRHARRVRSGHCLTVWEPRTHALSTSTVVHAVCRTGYLGLWCRAVAFIQARWVSRSACELFVEQTYSQSRAGADCQLAINLSPTATLRAASGHDFTSLRDGTLTHTQDLDTLKYVRCLPHFSCSSEWISYGTVSNGHRGPAWCIARRCHTSRTSKTDPDGRS